MLLAIGAMKGPVVGKDNLEVPHECDCVRKLSKENNCLAKAVVFSSFHQEPGISILIQANQVWKLLTNEVCSDENELYLVTTVSMFGYILRGAIYVGNPIDQTLTKVYTSKPAEGSNSDIAGSFKNFWEI